MGEATTGTSTWPEQFNGSNPILKPEHILAIRRIQRQNQSVTQVLVQWQHQAPITIFFGFCPTFIYK